MLSLAPSQSLSLRGRSFVITGANTGVGRATAEALSARGASLVLACRERERARAVLERVERGEGACSVVEMDLADLASVRRAAREIAARASPIHGLINNAGVGGARGLTKDGFEIAFGVNHLGHYLLTRLLVPMLARGARVVHLSSGSHARARSVDFGAFVRPTQSLTGIDEYAVSKLCVMLFHHELARRFAANGWVATSHAVDPGDVASDAWRHVPWPIRALMVRGMRTPEEGARTSVFCATAPSLAGTTGGFYKDERQTVASALSRDPDLAAAVWELSARLTGLPP